MLTRRLRVSNGLPMNGYSRGSVIYDSLAPQTRGEDKGRGVLISTSSPRPSPPFNGREGDDAQELLKRTGIICVSSVSICGRNTPLLSLHR
jgi:hypothetical protein